MKNKQLEQILRFKNFPNFLHQFCQPPPLIYTPPYNQARNSVDCSLLEDPPHPPPDNHIFGHLDKFSINPSITHLYSLTDCYPEPNYCFYNVFLRIDCRWGGFILQNKIFLFLFLFTLSPVTFTCSTQSSKITHPRSTTVNTI